MTHYAAHFKKALFISTALLSLGCQAASVQDKSDDDSSLFATTNPAHLKPAKSHTAKNIILFIGDGMGISTITAARIFDGQNKGLQGEDHMLSFERFGDIALVKTYNLDSQVPDSAGTASAISTGLKTQIGKVSVQPDALYAGCANSADIAPTTLPDLAKQAGLAVGIVTTTRLTHATPAAFYGHNKSRDFESDMFLDDDAKNMGCTDFATQMIDANLDLALGGGRDAFIDTERDDGVNLITQWDDKSASHKTISTRAELMSTIVSQDGTNTQNTQNIPNILGLFADSHMAFEVDRPQDTEPSLTEMTQAAIHNLTARQTGYFLMVEAGRIDHAHHGTNAYRALSETTELSRAVQAALARTNPEETLILVTADHSHPFTIAGYAQRGNPILGLVKSIGAEDYARDLNDNTYTTLGYYTGPVVSDPRETLTDNIVQSENFQQRSTIELESGAHSGEDVMLYAYGAGAQYVGGAIDQKEIFDIIKRNFAN